ncbi:heat shock protein gp96 precursor, partial [Dimargaris cristalligena]
EQHQFDTEVPRLMNLIINSIYKNKDVFLRELISNASDALDKLRHQALLDPTIMKDESNMEIKISSDPNNRILVIRDTGIGMTKEQLRENLGTIAKSGTAEYLKHLEKKSGEGDAESEVNDLIGQFGVGFYSAFLVADKVTFTSKHPSEDKQYVWTSGGGGDYSIHEDLPENDIGRGSMITLHFKDTDTEFLSQSTLEGLIEKHSSFINFPIYLWSKTTETIEVEVEDDDEKDEEDEEEDEGPATETKTIEKESWIQVNSQKPIWLRDPKEVTDKEYYNFYQSFAKDTKDPLTYSHYKGEGSVNFRGLLFVPAQQPSDYIMTFQSVVNNVKLFVKRVFITDELGDFLPKYLNFIKVLIDADDLPLNVSRETLQNSRELMSVKKTIIRKALDMLARLSKKDPAQYDLFLSQFGTNLRLGITEDTNNKAKIAKLLRFPSSHSDKTTSFTEYIARMKKGQKNIYFIAAPELEQAKNSPFVEALQARGYEVLYMTGQLDEYTMQSLSEIDGKKIRNVAQSGVEFGDEDAETKNYEAEMKETYSPLAVYLEKSLSEHIEKVVISNRLTTSPCAIAANQMGWSGTMERFMKAQNRGQEDFMTKFMLSQKKVLEINPKHPLIRELLNRVVVDGEDKHLSLAAEILYETAAIRSGYDLQDAGVFSRKVESFLRHSLDVDDDLEAEVNLKPAPEHNDDEEDDEEV